MTKLKSNKNMTNKKKMTKIMENMTNKQNQNNYISNYIFYSYII